MTCHVWFLSCHGGKNLVALVYGVLIPTTTMGTLHSHNFYYNSRFELLNELKSNKIYCWRVSNMYVSRILSMHERR